MLHDRRHIVDNVMVTNNRISFDENDKSRENSFLFKVIVKRLYHQDNIFILFYSYVFQSVKKNTQK